LSLYENEQQASQILFPKDAFQTISVILASADNLISGNAASGVDFMKNFWPKFTDKVKCQI
jgi:hypothetical protein